MCTNLIQAFNRCFEFIQKNEQEFNSFYSYYSGHLPLLTASFFEITRSVFFFRVMVWFWARMGSLSRPGFAIISFFSLSKFDINLCRGRGADCWRQKGEICDAAGLTDVSFWCFARYSLLIAIYRNLFIFFLFFEKTLRRAAATSSEQPKISNWPFQGCAPRRRAAAPLSLRSAVFAGFPNSLELSRISSRINALSKIQIGEIGSLVPGFLDLIAFLLFSLCCFDACDTLAGRGWWLVIRNGRLPDHFRSCFVFTRKQVNQISRQFRWGNRPRINTDFRSL